MQTSVKLPRITHPSHRRCNTDIESLKLQGNGMISSRGRDNHSAVSGVTRKVKMLENKKTRGRSSTVPVCPRSRPQSSSTHLSTQQLIDVLMTKFHGNGYFTIRNAFNAFDYDKRGFVSKEAIYRIICNILNGITRQQFTELMQKLNLANKQTITFHDLYSKFRILSSNMGRTTVDRLTHHGPRLLTADRVHSVLAARAENCVHHLSDFLPRWKGLDGELTRVEFRNVLSYLSLPLNDDEYAKLWLRYDPHNKGFITGSEIMERMGVTITTTRPSTMSTIISDDYCYTPLSDDVDEDIAELIQVISQKLKNKTNLFLKALRSQDQLNTGKVTSDQIISSLHEHAIPIASEHCIHLLLHLGHQPNNGVDYNTLVKQLTSVSPTSITNCILTDKNQRFTIPDRVCVSTADAESRLICTLQKDFLHLLSRLKLHDNKRKGFITRDDFVKVLESLAPPSSKRAINTLTDNIQDKENGLIPYSQFLAMFEGSSVTSKDNSSSDKEEKALEENTCLVKANETMNKLSYICKKNPQKIMDTFEEVDYGNTDRITRATLQQMLFRLGLNVQEDTIDEIWRSVLKNKDGSIDPWELIRQFGRYASHVSARARIHFSDDHMFMRSKYLHRDEDMVLKNLKMILQTHFETLSNIFKQYDTRGCGFISQDIFVEAILGLSPNLSPTELSYLTRLYSDPTTHSINYNALLKSIPSEQPTYVIGNNMQSLLSTSRPQPLSLPVMQQRISTPPQCGLPGTKALLQRKFQQRWSDLRKQFKLFDPAGSGFVTIKDFRYILNHQGVTLGREDMSRILEMFDPTLTGTIDYSGFFNVLMGGTHN